MLTKEEILNIIGNLDFLLGCHLCDENERKLFRLYNRLQIDVINQSGPHKENEKEILKVLRILTDVVGAINTLLDDWSSPESTKKTFWRVDQILKSDEILSKLEGEDENVN
jgi:hypothetical protein